MKILNLKFKNINSLAGEWEIDFTRPEFTENGLFAITGKTGSGKSSILDAISLALYGKTPRVDVTGNSNDVMTRGTADCYAEIAFETAGKTWKATWKQERARTGTLKQIERCVADENNKIIADRISIKGNRKADEKTVNEKIEEILGLTFEQFTKVVMLAQGSFAAFLQADKADKGELLEQITGTEIYGIISKEVFERWKAENQKFENINIELGAIKILTEEETTDLQTEITDFENSKKQLDSELQIIDKAKKWLNDLADLQKQMAEGTEKLPGLEANVETAKNALNQANIELKAAKEEQEKAALVFVKIREWDTKIAEKKNVLNPIFVSLKKAEQEKENLTKKMQKQTENLAELKVDLQQKMDWKTKNVKYESLVGNYTAIENQGLQVQTLLCDLQNKQNVHIAAQKDLADKNLSFTNAVKHFDEKHAALEKKTQELMSQKEKLTALLDGRELTALKDNKENLIRSGTNIKVLIDNLKNIISNKRNIENCQQIITENSEKQKELSAAISTDQISVENLKKQIDILAENIKLTRIVQSLEEHRQSLEDGVQCPLCGATEHPFAKGNEPKIGEKEKELKALEKQSDETNKRILTNEKLQATAKTNVDNALNNKLIADKELAENRKKTGQILSEIPDPDFEIVESDDCITKSEQIRAEKQSEYQQLNLLISSAEKLEKEIKNLQEEIIPKYQSEEKSAEKLKTDADTAKKMAEKEVENAANLAAQSESKYRQENENLKNTLAEYGIENITNLKKCLENWTNNSSAIEKLTTLQTQLKNDIQLINQEIEQNQKIIEEKTGDKKNLEKEKQNYEDERKELFGDKKVEDEEMRLKNLLEQKEKARTIAESEKTDTDTKLTQTKAVIEQARKNLNTKQEEKITEKTLEELQAEYTGKKPVVDELLQKIGANRQALDSNNRNLKQNSQKLTEKEKQQAIKEKWDRLNTLIGSADGKKYRNYAQALTFENLIVLANHKLQQMSERYILKRTGDMANPFELSVIDKFQNCDERTAQNLSGGEKFIVSLSLALGLANMASRNMRIDTMFIDEGFGTLDSDYLDVALTALSNLQSEGKLIGVISHLTALNERIATHISVIQKGDGRSQIEIHL
jgi:exonuclease SbcC